MIRILAGLMLSVSLICGCAAQSLDTLRRERFEQLPRKYSQFDLKLAWDTRITEHGIAVEGLIWNLRWQHAESLEVWVSLLDPDGKVLTKAVGLVIPNPLNINEVSDFSVRLPMKPPPGSKLRFTYSYYGVDDTEASTFWLQTFETAP